MAHLRTLNFSAEETRLLQLRLKMMGKDLGDSGVDRDGIDGIYGRHTRAALDSIPRRERQEIIDASRRQAAAFQAKHGRQPTPQETAPDAPMPMSRTQEEEARAAAAKPGYPTTTTVKPNTAAYHDRPAAGTPQAPAASGKTAIFDMKTGTLTLPNGQTFEAGSGKGQGKDNPAMEGMRSRGPIPEGTWSVGTVAPHSYHMANGSIDTTPSMRLSPTDPRQAMGRDGFLIHHMHSANFQSIGCLVLTDADMKKLISARDAGVFTHLQVTRDARMLAQGPRVGQPLKGRQFAGINTAPSPFSGLDG